MLSDNFLRSASTTRYRGWAVLITVATLGLLLACRNAPEGTSRPISSGTSTLNDQGLQTATSTFIDDLLMASSAMGDSLLTQPQALALAKIDLAVSAQTFESDYEANELAGDVKYKNKRFLLSGVIRSIEKDFSGSAFLTLSSQNLLGVRAQLNDRGFQGVTSLSKGTKVFLVCRSSDRIVGTEVAGDCQRLSQYLEEIRPDLSRSVREFLEGHRPLPRKLGEGLLMMYVTATLLPASSACLSEANKQCEEEITRIIKDPAQAEGIRAQVKQMEAGLKLE